MILESSNQTFRSKNTKTINTPSAKVDTAPTNKGIDGNVNEDIMNPIRHLFVLNVEKDS